MPGDNLIGATTVASLPTSVATTSRGRRGPHLGPTSRTVILYLMAVISGLAMALTAMVTLSSPISASGEVASRALPAEIALKDVSAAISDSQEFFLTAVESQDAVARASAITSAQEAGRLQDFAWSTYRSLAFNRAYERTLQQSYEASLLRSRQLGAALVSTAPTDPAFATLLAEERLESRNQSVAVADLESTIYWPTVRGDVALIHKGVVGGRNAVLISYGALAALFSATGLALLKGARRDQRQFDRETTALRVAGEHADFEGSLQRGLEMAPTEDATFEVVGQALSMVAIDVPTELLLADSSRAHFRQVLSTDTAGDCACRVGAPGDCPAANSGQTQYFENTAHLDTCRFLRGQDDPAWAVCVPLSIAGRTTGVLHAQRALEHPAPGNIADLLGLVARKAGDRIGALRVLARTEAQAQVDPLTGLPNRRTLENQVRELLVVDSPYVVAFADLDFFKSINDSHGHDTGDRALRLFARVLRDSIRPRDLLSRYGGEEFVAVLPDCSLPDARGIGERIRSELARALERATVPPFTVTIGLAGVEPGVELVEAIASADAAMLRAKSEGRDRVVAAGDAAPTSPASESDGCESDGVAAAHVAAAVAVAGAAGARAHSAPN